MLLLLILSSHLLLLFSYLLYNRSQKNNWLAKDGGKIVVLSSPFPFPPSCNHLVMIVNWGAH